MSTTAQARCCGQSLQRLWFKLPVLGLAASLCCAGIPAPCACGEEAEKSATAAAPAAKDAVPPAAAPAPVATAPATTAPAATTPAAPGQTPAAQKPAEGPAAAKPPATPTGPAVVTIYEEKIASAVKSIENGELVLASEPPRRVAMDEAATVYLGNAAVLEAAWVGQDNHDVAQVGGAPAKANGIQDIHIRLTGLRSGQPVKQITLIFQHPKRRGLWRLDPSKSPAWRLVMERAADSQQAELYLEPNELDAFEQRFAITVAYGDDQTAKAEIKAATHTDHQLKSGASPAVVDNAPSGPPVVIVHGRDRSQIKGELLELTDESLSLRTSWAQEFKLPLVHVGGVRFPAVNMADAAQKFEAALANPGAQDAAIVQGKEQGLSVVTGTAHGLSEGKLSFTYEGEKRSINQARLAGVIFAAQPKRRPKASPYQIVSLLNGDRLTGSWTAADEQSLQFAFVWGGQAALPRTAVEKIELRNGKVTFLSDLEPVSVEEVPYFGRKFPYRRDQGFDGGPLKLKDKTYPKGLAVHSRSALVYGIDGEYASFKAMVGFDPSAGGRGRVALRVLGDGRELFVEPDLRGTAEPLALDVPIEGVKELSLVIEFGQEEDTGDRILWAEPRVFRAGKQNAEKPAAR
jgi:NPCBM/NEW2 domain-containing protein